MAAFFALCKADQSIGLTVVLDDILDQFINGACSGIIFGEFSIGKGVHIAISLIWQIIDRVGEELVWRAHCLVRLIASFLPWENTIVSILLHLALSDHLARGVTVVRKIVV